MHIELEYAPPSEPRYLPAPHPGLYQRFNNERDRYATRLKAFIKTAAGYDNVPLDPAPNGPCWHNWWFPPLDAITLTGMIQTCQPSLYIEIGSGSSTQFARRAVNLYSPTTRIVSIDPQPRIGIDSLCEEIIRSPLETVDLAVFDRLQAGDFIFVDGSHRCFMNSDVTTMFLDVLPRLQSGVMVQFHDILLPWDYPRDWVNRYYSEQYLLACWLLSGQRLQVELPNHFISQDNELLSLLNPIWDHVVSPQRMGGSFWVSID